MNQPNTNVLLKGIWWQLVTLGIIILTYKMITYKGLPALLLIILIAVLTTATISHVKNHSKPSVKQYFKMVVYSSIGVVVMWYMLSWLGHYGWVGFVLIVLLLAAYKVYQGRELFMQTVEWLRSMKK